MYNASNHYWIVGGDESRLYSSARAKYVPADDELYKQWLNSGIPPTRIQSEEDLADVIGEQYPPGWPAHVVRQERNRLLAEADIAILKAEDAGSDTSALRAYRQALRDVPAQPGFPQNVTYPTL
ncbi:hypothetical protein OYT1_ch1598 [Ferriphaselus amnicola]|uniref:Phage tail assembly chaperone-like domain-containing protein n=1 Tax=Ferriphaselus amnicola TaxID=1188319 RepID=A0A2Z6GD74_9PROT|nr:phage tail assembly chaperone [Ferriphaselus amnicola]BBE51145.1 hypothetical protein OYT1_ch1598 [Ferriphaselus amnicola]